MEHRIDRLYKLLGDILDPEMRPLIDTINKAPGTNSFVMRLPEDTDLTPQEASRLIAQSSNLFGESCRLASLARAKEKIAEAKFKHKFRTSQGDGKNKEEREAAAYEAAQEEYNDYIVASAIVDLCESIEVPNRIASESARRMLLAADQMNKAESRFEATQTSLTGTDFRGF